MTSMPARGANTDPERPRSRRRLMLAAGASVLAVWAVALIVVAGRLADGDTASAATPTAEPSSAPIAVAFQAPTRRVVLPAGAEQVEEYPTRFPRSAHGAAAAAVALTRYSASLDYQVVNEVLRLYAATGAEAADAADRSAAAAVSAGRARLGLPMTGPAPLDASVFAEPFALRWATEGPDAVVVSVLSAVEYRSGADRTRELVATNTRWQWDSDVADWRVVPGEAGDPPPAAEIGTPEFNEARWAALAERRP